MNNLKSSYFTDGKNGERGDGVSGKLRVRRAMSDPCSTYVVERSSLVDYQQQSQEIMFALSINDLVHIFQH